MRRAAAEFAAREEAARAADCAARGGALVRGAGGSCTRFTTGFGISFSIFFGFGFGLCGGVSTTLGFGTGASSGTGIVCCCSTSSGCASVIWGPGVTSAGDCVGGATSRGASSIMIAAGGSPPARRSRIYKIQKTIAA